MVLLGGLCLGLVFALMFGKLLFLVLLKLMRSLPSLDFSPSPLAYLAVIGLFLAVFVCTCLYNLAQVHLSNPIQLMQSQRQGEKDSRLVVPKAILGLLLLGAAYYFAWTIQKPGMAMGIFFLLVLMVIVATYFLFQAGSIAVLRLLRANKNFYYQPSHFVSVASMFHRMRQNASSLATICILSTMLTVTLTGTLALYLGQEETLKPLYPYNVCYHIIQNEENPDPQMTPTAIDAFLAEQAQAQGLTMSAQTDGRLVHTENTQNEGYSEPLVGFLVVYADSTCQTLPHSVLRDDYLYFDLAGPEDACLDFVEQIPAKMAAAFGAPEEDFRQINDIFSARQTGYGTYGGLLFLGAFFSILFLAVAVLMLYFKQITEGNEDRERFALLQKVGMDQTQVHRVINSQVLWVFFLPLGLPCYIWYLPAVSSPECWALSICRTLGWPLPAPGLSPWALPCCIGSPTGSPPGCITGSSVGYGGSPMLKTHLPYLFLLLGVFLLFVCCCPRPWIRWGKIICWPFIAKLWSKQGPWPWRPRRKRPVFWSGTRMAIPAATRPPFPVIPAS